MKSAIPFVAILACSCTHTGNSQLRDDASSVLPFSGAWKGTQQCIELGSEVPTAVESLIVTFDGNTIWNGYEGNAETERQSSWSVEADAKAPMTSEEPGFFTKVAATKVISTEGRRLFEKLAGALRSGRTAGVSTFRQTGEVIVEGRGFCVDASWCHMWAKKKVTFPSQEKGGSPVTLIIEGADTVSMAGSELIRVGYAFDPNDRSKVYACEGRMNPRSEGTKQ